MERPLRLEYVDPATLLSGAHPRNWRTHGEEQRAAFEGLLAEVGWADALLYNEKTGRLLDGHMRAKQALANRLPAIPVLIGAWPEAVELKILASRDTLGLMAGIDPKAWDSVLREVDTGCSELMGLFSDLSEEWGTIPRDNPRGGAGDDEGDALVAAPDEGPGDDDPSPGPEDQDTVAPDVVFASDNEWGIPTLDVRMQADAWQFPLTIWGSVGRKRPMPGTWCFYTADRRFEPVWENPGAVLESGPSYIIEPNFSTHPQMPRAKVLWDVYRKRFLARWWQSKGLRVFVDLNVGEEVRDLNLLGVPRGWRAFATRSHSGGKWIEAEFAHAAEHAGTEDLVFLVYGGGSEVRGLCASRGWHWVAEHSDAARGKGPKP